MEHLLDPYRYITSQFHEEYDKPMPLRASFLDRSFGLDRWEVGSNLSKELREAIYKRDFGVCAFCGFHSNKYQEVLLQNGKSWLLDNAVTACIFCAQCLAIDNVKQMRSGVLVYLPELSQQKINNTLKIIYVCRISQGDNADKAKSLLDLLVSRRKQAETRLTDDPEVLVQKFSEARSESELQKLSRAIANFRLLSLDRRIIKEADLEFNQFPQILAFWRCKDGPFGGMTPQKMDLSEFDTITDILTSSD